MLDFRFLDFCRDDTLFYDAPEPARVEADYVVDGIVGTGWSTERGREWTVCTPPDCSIPDQGWKIHVSATPETAPQMLQVVSRYCLDTALMFKFISNPEILGRRGSKYGDRTASGKFITLYPRDESELQRTLIDLDATIGGTPAPYILSDLRWREGPLYVRYGGFRLKLVAGPQGTMVPAINTPDGELVPDQRRPSFRPPEWVTLPSCLAEQLEARNAGTLRDFPFRVYKALHFSNGGGVYRARDKGDESEVLLREARPLAGLDGSGADAVTRMEREHWALEKLQGLPFAPRVIDYRVGHEHRYLAREFVEGEPLVDLLRERHPYSNGTNTAEGRADYRNWVVPVLRSVEEAVMQMHERGVVFGDLHPGNILVRPDGGVSFIDLETASSIDEEKPQSMGALGFYAPKHLCGKDIDLYALDVLWVTAFTPTPQLVPWGAAKVAEMADLAVEEFALPAAIADRIRDRLTPERLRSATDHAVAWPADPTEPDFRSRIAESITTVATPERDDRLYPGDSLQFLRPGGGSTLAHGAAGTLWVLNRSNLQVPESHVDWLLSHLPDLEDLTGDFWDGSAGLALALDDLGAEDLAERLVTHAVTRPGRDPQEAAAGALVDRLLARRRGHTGLPERVLAIADRVAAARGESAPGLRPEDIGYLRERSAASILLAVTYRSTGDRRFREAAFALHRLALDAVAQVPEARRPMAIAPGLMGSAGLLLTSAHLQRTFNEPSLNPPHLRKLVADQFAIPGGLFKGRAGSVLALAATGPANCPILESSLAALGWEALAAEPGRIDFLGDHGHRLSTDLATGSTGVLAALSTASSGTDCLSTGFLSVDAGGAR